MARRTGDVKAALDRRRDARGLGTDRAPRRIVSLLSSIDAPTLLLGVGVFLARIADVSIGTMRTISIVYGRTTSAFFLGIGEVVLWLLVITAVLNRVGEQPILGAFYALGFATGGVVGIKLERWLALGNVVLRVISQSHGTAMASALRDQGYPVTTFVGEGRSGPVVELYIVCSRADLQAVVDLVRRFDPNVFTITEPANSVSRVYRPLHQPWTGWRAVLKKK